MKRWHERVFRQKQPLQWSPLTALWSVILLWFPWCSAAVLHRTLMILSSHPVSAQWRVSTAHWKTVGTGRMFSRPTSPAFKVISMNFNRRWDIRVWIVKRASAASLSLFVPTKPELLDSEAVNCCILDCFCSKLNRNKQQTMTFTQ